MGSKAYKNKAIQTDLERSHIADLTKKKSIFAIGLSDIVSLNSKT